MKIWRGYFCIIRMEVSHFMRKFGRASLNMSLMEVLDGTVDNMACIWDIIESNQNIFDVVLHAMPLKERDPVHYCPI